MVVVGHDVVLVADAGRAPSPRRTARAGASIDAGRSGSASCGVPAQVNGARDVASAVLVVARNGRRTDAGTSGSRRPARAGRRGVRRARTVLTSGSGPHSANDKTTPCEPWVSACRCPTKTTPHPRWRCAAVRTAAGFDEVSLPESRQHRAVFSMAAAAMATTRHIRISIGVANPVTRHPAVLAMEAATLGRDRRPRAAGVRRRCRGVDDARSRLRTRRLAPVHEHRRDSAGAAALARWSGSRLHPDDVHGTPGHPPRLRPTAPAFASMWAR